jgi:hypothetical protein
MTEKALLRNQRNHRLVERSLGRALQARSIVAEAANDAASIRERLFGGLASSTPHIYALGRKLDNARIVAKVSRQGGTGNLIRAIDCVEGIDIALNHDQDRELALRLLFLLQSILTSVSVELDEWIISDTRSANVVEVESQDQYSDPLVKSTTEEAGPNQVAIGIIDRALRLIPKDARARYREEYSAELYELAERGASRRDQVAYAFMVARSSWSLRRIVSRPLVEGD